MNYLEIINKKIHTSFNSFAAVLKQWKAGNETIVFTNGCFDLVHSGHIEYLAKSASMGTKLVIGLNSDKSVRLLKGSSRPVVNESSRAIILASLAMVDAVVLFSEETPYNLISDIKPQILVKGDDYKIKEIAGWDVVIGNGGKVETIQLVPSISTSEIIKKIKSIE